MSYPIPKRTKALARQSLVLTNECSPPPPPPLSLFAALSRSLSLSIKKWNKKQDFFNKNSRTLKRHTHRTNATKMDVCVDLRRHQRVQD